MGNLENEIKVHYLFSKFLYQYRYVDDVLFFVQERIDKNFVHFINPNIKITSEIEDNKTVNFLDLTVKNNDNKHEDTKNLHVILLI